MTVTEYYTKFKSLIDELGEQQPLPECTCGASRQLLQREEDNHVHLFLGGLDGDRFAHIKGTILNTDPLPSLRKAFSHVLREEARFNDERSRDVKQEGGAVFHSYKQKNKGDARPRCDHCGKVGHEKAKCFEIIGYPSNWDTRKTNKRTNKSGSNSGGGAKFAWAEENQCATAGHDHSLSNPALHGSQGRRNNEPHDGNGSSGQNHEEDDWIR